MNILYITSRFYPDVISGGQVSAYYIVKSQSKRHKVTVLTLYEGTYIKKELVEGITIIRIPFKRQNLSKLRNLDILWIKLTIEGLKYTKKNQPDIIHLLNFEPIFFLPIALKLFLRKILIVTTVNGPLFSCFTQTSVDFKDSICIKCRISKRFLCSVSQWGKITGLINYLYSFWYMNLLKFCYIFIDDFYVVSKAMIPILINMNVKQSKIKIIHNPNIFTDKKISLKQKNKIKLENSISSKYIVLFVGRLSKQKGIHIVIQALQKINNVTYLIIGKKRGYYHVLKKLVKSLKLESRVKFLGFVEHNNLKKYYQISDLVVMPETFYEPLSRLILESSYFGVPVIATNIGGNSELIEHKKTGLLLETNNVEEVSKTMKLILKNKKLRIKMGKMAKEKIKSEFGISLIGEQLSKNYKILFNSIFH